MSVFCVEKYTFQIPFQITLAKNTLSKCNEFFLQIRLRKKIKRSEALSFCALEPSEFYIVCCGALHLGGRAT